MCRLAQTLGVAGTICSHYSPSTTRDYTSIINSLEHTVSISVEALVEQASKLSAEDRTHLADLLLASVSDDESTEVDVSWEEEIQRRVDAVRAGTAKTVSAEDVHAQARRL